MNNGNIRNPNLSRAAMIMLLGDHVAPRYPRDQLFLCIWSMMQAVDPPRCLLRHAQRFHYDTASRLYFQSMTFVSGAGDGQQTISYNPANQIVSRSGAANSTLTYDPLGRLFEAAG